MWQKFEKETFSQLWFIILLLELISKIKPTPSQFAETPQNVFNNSTSCGFVSVTWLAAAVVGNSSASQFPQDAVARWRRHRRRLLLGREVWGWSKEVRPRWAAAASSGGRERKPPPPADLRETFHSLRRRCVVASVTPHIAVWLLFLHNSVFDVSQRRNRTTENICMTSDAPETQTLQTVYRQSTSSRNFCKVLCFIVSVMYSNELHELMVLAMFSQMYPWITGMQTFEQRMKTVWFIDFYFTWNFLLCPFWGLLWKNA